jgi:hypothetical protein
MGRSAQACSRSKTSLPSFRRVSSRRFPCRRHQLAADGEQMHKRSGRERLGGPAQQCGSETDAPI